jgi:LCP family protein required for cell wall assembly
MNQFRQINRLIKKGLFDERLKKQRQRKEFIKSLKITSSILFLLVLLLFGLSYLIKLIPSASIEIFSKAKEAEKNLISPAPPGFSDRGSNQSTEKKTSIFKSVLPFKLSKKSPSAELNILALGRPGKGYPGQDLTDTIILVHLKPAEKKAALISLPRDLLVKVPNRGQLTKINSLYSLAGIETLKEKIEEITGLPIDYYVLIDLVVAKEIIDLVDGLNVFVPQDINDPFFPGPNYSYQAFILPAGWRYLDGEMALKYIRTRYTSPNGDFDRMARQQQVIQLLKQKVLSLNPLWDLPTYLKIFYTLKDHIETNLSLWEIKSLWQIAKDIRTDQITNLVIDKKKTNLLVDGQVTFGNQPASVVYPRAGQENYSEIRNFIRNFID